MSRKILMVAVLGFLVLRVSHAQNLPSASTGNLQGTPTTVQGLPSTPGAEPQPVGGAGGDTGGSMIVYRPISTPLDSGIVSTPPFTPEDSVAIVPGTDLGAGVGSKSGLQKGPPEEIMTGRRLSSTALQGNAATWSVSGFGQRSTGPASLSDIQDDCEKNSLQGASPYARSTVVAFNCGAANTGFGAAPASQLQSTEGMSFGYQRPQPATPNSIGELPGMAAPDFGEEGPVEESPESSIQTPGEGFKPYVAVGAGLDRGIGAASQPRGTLRHNPRRQDAARMLREERMHPAERHLRRMRDLRSREKSHNSPR